jgi:hypothetical protein
MRALITVIRDTKGLNVQPRCIGTAWSLPFGAILSILFYDTVTLICVRLAAVSQIIIGSSSAQINVSFNK